MAAKNKFLNAMKMPSIDDMFSSEADRQRESGDLVTEVPLSELHPFVGHPFEVRDDEDMQKLVDSIRENGVLTNLTVRRRAEGGYEIISGHRRFHAAQRAGLDRVKVQVRDIDDDQAIIDMVDSNIQREHISPMEKARAYAMRLDAAQRKRGRPSKENYSQVGNNFGTRTSSDELAEKVGESKNQIFRYVRLNNLVPDLQKKVDDGSLKFNPAVELSYLLTYTKNREGYLIPSLSLPNQPNPYLNRYARLRLEFLEQNEPTLCDQLMLEGTLLTSCSRIGRTAQQMVDKTLRKLMQTTPMPNRKTNPLGWTQMANSLKKQAEEAVLPMLYEV